MKHLKLFENFDRYEFGVIYGHAKISEMLNNTIRKESIPFTESEINELKSVIGYKKTLDVHKGFVMVYDNINKTQVEIYSLGDYCYVVVVYDRKSGAHIVYYDKMYTVDAMENLLKILSEELFK